MKYLYLTTVLLCGSASGASAADRYEDQVRPFLQTYCFRCHRGQQARGELDLGQFAHASDVTKAFRRWNNIIEFIRDGEMPPEDAKQPTLEERASVVNALEGLLLAKAKEHAGDPGIVLPRRLSNAEYDQSIRDLTGIDIQPTREFPADPAAGEGFNNTGEALSMSPGLLKKYLAAAEHVSNHLVLKPHGITFAPFPVTSYNERKKLTEQAIIDFYREHDVRILDYLEAAWRYRYRSDADRNLSIESWAQRRGLSGKYLGLVWKTLDEARSSSGYLKQIGGMWESLPAPSGKLGKPTELLRLDRFVQACRSRLVQQEEPLIRSNAGNWPISHLDFRTRTAASRDRFDPRQFQSQHLLRFEKLSTPKKGQTPPELTLRIQLEPAFEGSKDNAVLLHRPLFSKADNLPRNADEEVKQEVVTLRAILEQHAPEIVARLGFGKDPQGRPIDADSIAVQAPARIEIPITPDMLRSLDGKRLLVDCRLESPEGSVHVRRASGKLPADPELADVALLIDSKSELAKALIPSAQQFCNTFPNRFYYVDEQRGLAAGFHLVEGFFRDDLPLVQKVLSDQEQEQLNQLWEELNFVTQSTEVLLRGFVWFERSERHVLHDKRFDFLRPEDPKLVEEDLLGRFEKLYLEKLGVKLVGESIKPEQPSERYEMIHGFFEQVRAGLQQQQELTKVAEGHAWRDFESLARRAYRRDLVPQEIQELRALYDALREQGQSVEEALRSVFTAVLMSPDFCYRFSEAPAGTKVYPLSDNALASRLSFFLWSSIPDEELLAEARQGNLSDPAKLLAQSQRMLKDPRIKRFAREFFGQWLRYRDYLSKDPINAAAFPTYSDELRQAMFDEPVRLATYLIQEDRPVTDLLHADFTFVNGVLARHYGGDIESQYRARQAKLAEELQQREILPPGNPEQVWHRVDNLRTSGRGGLIGMGVILTKNSRGERTSPVKRGFWTVHHLLGQHFPPPPADVPELPAKEKEAKKTIRDLLAEHTANQRCAICHTHFDGLGLAMEGFDPIGRARTKDLAGRPIDDVATLPNGQTAKGISGLIEYVERERLQDFTRTLCRKFLGYALGRSVLLSDQPLLQEMERELKKNNYRFSVLFKTVIQSPQFGNLRGREFAVDSR